MNNYFIILPTFDKPSKNIAINVAHIISITPFYDNEKRYTHCNIVTHNEGHHSFNVSFDNLMSKLEDVCGSKVVYLNY